VKSYSEVHLLLHRLWTRAVGTPGYVKADWKALALVLDELWEESTGKTPRLDPEPSPAERPTAWERILR